MLYAEKLQEYLTPLSIVCTQCLGVYRALFWVPTPLGSDAAPQRFSEGRALETAAYLSDTIGRRIVSCIALDMTISIHLLVQCVQYLNACHEMGAWSLQVSTPQIEESALYVEQQAKLLQKLAQQTRPDLVVEVCPQISSIVVPIYLLAFR